MAVENKGGENPHDFNLKSSVLGIQTFSLHQTFSNTKFCSRNTVSYKQNNPTNQKKKTTENRNTHQKLLRSKRSIHNSDFIL